MEWQRKGLMIPPLKIPSSKNVLEEPAYEGKETKLYETYATQEHSEKCTPTRGKWSSA